MTRIFAVATLAVLFGYPPAGHTMENGPLRDGGSLQNGMMWNGLALHGAVTRTGMSRNRLTLRHAAGAFPRSLPSGS